MPRKKAAPEKSAAFREKAVHAKESCTSFWAGSFGDDYTERNRVNWEDRVPFLQRMLEATMGPSSFLDVGCNAGWNLRALRKITDNKMEASGLDINQKALAEATEAGFDVYNAPADQCDQDPFGPDCAQMVIVSGVLIHIPPEQLDATLTAIRNASQQYVLAIEYRSSSGQDEAIEYRGHDGRLWRRDFGEHFKRIGGLEVIETGPADGYGPDSTYWLMERVQ